MYLRLSTNSAVKMPPLARNVVDTNAVTALAQWINTFVPGSLPYPWQHQDIGGVGIGGDAQYTTNLGTFTVAGSGVDIWGTADSFHFAYQNAGGDCEIIARVATITDTDPWAKAGVMIRESVAPGARNTFIALTAQNGVEYQWRGTNGGENFYVQGPIVTPPYWLRLTRTNNLFKAFHSPNGTAWTQLGANLTMTLASNLTAGLAVTAVNNSQLNTSTFDSVVVRSQGTTDTDGDGMPDSYELANSFLPNNATDGPQDADNDRVTNFQEYLAGTNPRDSNSVLRLTRVWRQGNDLIFGFLSATGKTYAVERATNLPPTFWQTVTNIGPVATTNAVLTNSSGAVGPAGFYRVRLVP
jgi:hypothetical protein